MNQSVDVEALQKMIDAKLSEPVHPWWTILLCVALFAISIGLLIYWIRNPLPGSGTQPPQTPVRP